MKKQIIYIFVLVLSVVGIVLVITNTGHIRDTNGTNTNLARIDLADKIENDKFTYTSTPEGIMKTGTSSGVEGSNVDYKGITYNVKKITGVKLVQETYLAEGEELQITLATELVEGNIEIVILSPASTLTMPCAKPPPPPRCPLNPLV